MANPQAVDLSKKSNYDSTMLSRFGWTPDPYGGGGYLHVEFQSGSRYLYLNVPESIAQGLKDRAENPRGLQGERRAVLLRQGA